MKLKKYIKKAVPTEFFNRIEPLGHAAESALLQARFGLPARGLKVIGVTGTSGKTTTTTLVASILREAGYKTAYLTTAEFDLGTGPVHNPTRMTTTSTKALLKNIATIKKNNCEWLVLEITSHALKQRRAFGIKFIAGLYTNLTPEHLDYHKTFEDYKRSKLRLFKLVGKNNKGLGVGVVNADDEWAKEFAELVPKPISYGVKNKADYQAIKIKTKASGSSFVAVNKKGKAEFNIACNIPGSFNVNNSLAAVALCDSIGVKKGAIERGIANLEIVPGRMGYYKTPWGADVIIDYAHTPDSFEKLFSDLRPVVKGKMISVFGRPGQRDKAARPIQGEIAGRYCDIVILTEDDQRDEDNNVIMEEIAVGARKKGKRDGESLFMIDLRENAIQKAIDISKKGDLILLLSKGHELSIEVADGPKKWDEEKALKDAIKKRSKPQSNNKSKSK